MNYFTVRQTFSHAVFVPRAFQLLFQGKIPGIEVGLFIWHFKAATGMLSLLPHSPPHPPPHPVILVETLLTLAKSNSYVISS